MRDSRKRRRGRRLFTPRSRLACFETLETRALLSADGFAPVADHHSAPSEQDHTVSIYSIPNDPDFSRLWGLHETNDHDIDAPEAWDLTTGSGEVVIGVIDTGVDYTHQDLAPNIWVNPAECAAGVGTCVADGIDDDGNGYVDDFYGWDFAAADNDPFDDHGHGTHVAGIIAALGDNGTGAVGVNRNAQIMALRFMDANGIGSISDVVDAIEYATMMKRDYGVNVRLTCNSWGDTEYSQSLYDAIQASGEQDMLFIAAAGNDTADNDQTPRYPSSYDLDNIIAVASTDLSDGLSSFSNVGEASVDLGAPGSFIYSTVPNDQYTYMSGTSMAASHVSGVAALAWGAHPNATYSQVRDAILLGVDAIPSLQGNTVTAGRLNALNTLERMAALGQLTLAIADDAISENGGATTAIVTRSDPTGVLTVDLTSDDTSEAAVVASIVIADGQVTSEPFAIQAADDSLKDGVQTVTITANASGYAGGSDTLDVTDWEDGDMDGPVDEVEDGAANGGDGNTDAIPDRDQAHVASMPCHDDSGYVTLATSDSVRFDNAGTEGNPSPDAPEDVGFPAGFIRFGVHDLALGGPIVVSVYVETSANTYYQFGPTPDNPTPHWYPFMYNGTTGAKIYSDRVDLYFVDGERGDHDLAANGAIEDVGAPGVTDHPWQNPVLPLDVNNKDGVTPLDVLVLINDISANGARVLPPHFAETGFPASYLDVTGDGSVTALDVLQVIAHLNTAAGPGQGEGEGEGSLGPLAEGARADLDTAPRPMHDIASLSTILGTPNSELHSRFVESQRQPGSVKGFLFQMPDPASDAVTMALPPLGETIGNGATESGSSTPELGMEVDDDLVSILAGDSSRILLSDSGWEDWSTGSVSRYPLAARMESAKAGIR